jgi:hypothetical protein
MPKGHSKKDVIEYRGGRPELWTEEDREEIVPVMIDALVRGEGMLSRAVPHIRNPQTGQPISTPTLQKYMDKWPEVKEAYHSIVQANVDDVHSSMLEGIRNYEKGWQVAAIFYLKAIGKWQDTQHITVEKHEYKWQERALQAGDVLDDPDIVEGTFIEDNPNNW